MLVKKRNLKVVDTYFANSNTVMKLSTTRIIGFGRVKRFNIVTSAESRPNKVN